MYHFLEVNVYNNSISLRGHLPARHFTNRNMALRAPLTPLILFLIKRKNSTPTCHAAALRSVLDLTRACADPSLQMAPTNSWEFSPQRLFLLITHRRTFVRTLDIRISLVYHTELKDIVFCGRYKRGSLHIRGKRLGQVWIFQTRLSSLLLSILLHGERSVAESRPSKDYEGYTGYTSASIVKTEE